MQNTNVWARASVMIRETLSVDSTFADVLVTPRKRRRIPAPADDRVNAVGTTVTGIGVPE
ncbi:MAG: hypothetical protein ACM3SU_16350 [Acidobacteriota bacterium]